jgi:hypothetical protein
LGTMSARTSSSAKWEMHRFRAWGRVEYHLLCSEIDAAADWYEKMIDVHDPFAVVFAAIPLGKALLQSARRPRLASMMKLPP